MNRNQYIISRLPLYAVLIYIISKYIYQNNNGMFINSLLIIAWMIIADLYYLNKK